jgi:hypothetical protein
LRCETAEDAAAKEPLWKEASTGKCVRPACRVSNDPEPFQTQVVRQLGYIARPVRETSAWMIGAVTISWPVNSDDPNSTLRCGGVIDGEVHASPWRAVKGYDRGSTGISNLNPCEVSVIVELDHPGLGK